jgi:hypothetical protein
MTESGQGRRPESIVADAGLPTEIRALAPLLKDKLEAQKTLKSLEGERNRKRRELFDAQDAIDGQRDDLIKRIEGQFQQ